MKFNQLYPSRYLKASDVFTPLTLTIKAVIQEEVGQDGEEDKIKPVLHFSDSERGMVLNRTNGSMIESMYGDETDHWVGKRIQLYSTKVPFGGKIVDSIRVRPPHGDMVSVVPVAPAVPAITGRTSWPGKFIKEVKELIVKKDGQPATVWLLTLTDGAVVGTDDKTSADLAKQLVCKPGEPERVCDLVVEPGAKPGSIKLIQIDDSGDAPF